MASEVDICNLALFRIGQSLTIAALTETSNAARLCRTVYETCRDEVLEDFPWPFATKSVALAELTDTAPPGWTYQYAYPADCLHALRVCDDAGIRFVSRVPWCSDENFPPTYRVPFRVMAGPDDANAKVIVTDLSPAYLYYVREVTDSRVFSPLFVSALAWRLAAEIGPPLQASTTIVKDAYAGYYSMRDRAAARAFNESTPDAEPESPSIAVRY